jgi:Protein of unknown function (DUF3618)
MTTSGGTRNPGSRPASEADTLNAEQRPGPAATDDTTEMARKADAASAAPGDAQQLRQEIERTRQQLGDTVEELSAKADVKGRARAKAAELSGRVKGGTSRAKEKAGARAGDMRSQLAAGTGAAQKRAAAVGTPVWEATPEPVRQAVTKGASTAKRRRVPLAAAAGLFIAGYLVVRWLRSPAGTVSCAA